MFNYGVSIDPNYPLFCYNIACVYGGKDDVVTCPFPTASFIASWSSSGKSWRKPSGNSVKITRFRVLASRYLYTPCVQYTRPDL